MGGAYCAVYRCSSSRYQLKKWGKRRCKIHTEMTRAKCKCPRPYKLHRFPRNKDVLLVWHKRINIKDFTSNAYSRICSLHFGDGMPTKQDPYPSLKLGYDFKPPFIRSLPTKREPPVLPPTTKNQNPPLVDSGNQVKIHNQGNNLNGLQDHGYAYRFTTAPFPFNYVKNSSVIRIIPPLIRLNKEKNIIESIDEPQSLIEYTVSSSVSQTDTTLPDVPLIPTCPQITKNIESRSLVPVDIDLENRRTSVHLDHNYSSYEKYIVHDTKFVFKEVELNALNLDEKKCKYYTGVNLDIFLDICKVLAKKHDMNISEVSHENQILLFFMHLKAGLQFEDLGYRFGISQLRVSRIFNFWLPRVADTLVKYVCWLPKEIIKAILPKTYEKMYPDTTVPSIVDLTSDDN